MAKTKSKHKVGNKLHVIITDEVEIEYTLEELQQQLNEANNQKDRMEIEHGTLINEIDAVIADIEDSIELLT